MLQLQSATNIISTKTVKTQSPKNSGKSKVNQTIHACDKCPKKFHNQNRYDAHMRRHMGLKAFQCLHCDKECQKLSTLKAHIAAKHYDESQGQPEYKCDFDDCEKTYSIKVWIEFVKIKLNASMTLMLITGFFFAG